MTILPLTSDLLEQHFASFKETLTFLSNPGDLNLSAAHDTLQKIQQSHSCVRVAYDEHSHRIVGTITLLLEAVFWRGWSHAGHIENLVVHPDFQGQGIAQQLIQEAINYAKHKQCYKIILDCPDSLVWFYQKFGFEHKENCMKLYL